MEEGSVTPLKTVPPPAGGGAARRWKWPAVGLSLAALFAGACVIATQGDGRMKKANNRNRDRELRSQLKFADPTPESFSSRGSDLSTGSDGSHVLGLGDSPLLDTSAPTALIFSDRLDGIIPTIGSMIRSTSTLLNVVLVGDSETNARAKSHFEGRTAAFITMTVADAQADLMQQGLDPIWNWDEWHSSMPNDDGDDDWRNENTIHTAEWDDLHTHAHELNHLRFYIPYLSVVKDAGHVFFIDDDILVQKDLHQVTKSVSDKVGPNAGLTCPCNIWTWNDDCHHFDFKSRHANILEVSPLYGGRPTCSGDGGEDDKFCLPENFDDFVRRATPEGIRAEDQTAWNFGFCLFHSDNWKKLDLTTKYENSMRLNYELHEVPETSLVFGLGIPFLAFAGAVECWDEDDMKVRDGFGFIDWQRYQKTFGDDFFGSVDVAHYTGPSKPWVPKSPVEVNAISPWLDMMELEGLDVPEQLPAEPAKDLFAVLTAPRSGSEWLMTMLDQHPEVCASGESKKPEMGFPTEAMLSRGTPWLPVCSVKKGCTLGFVLDGIAEFTNEGTILDPPQCQEGFHVAHSDSNIDEHRQRLCNFIDALGGNFTKDSIVLKWTEAFAEEDKRFLGCGCPRATKVKGLKMMSGWLASPNSFNYINNMADTVFKGAKIIRLKRTNLWDRFKSLAKAQATALWHARKDGEMAGKEVTLTIPVEKMVADVLWMKREDDEGDEWARQHASDVLFVDYERCKADPEPCQSSMLEFLGVDASKVKSDAGISAFAKAKDPLHGIENAEEVAEALGANGFGSFIGRPDYSPVQLLVYETDPLETSPAARHIRRANQMRGINVTVFGQGSNFRGFGSKYAHSVPVLKELPQDSLVVLSDGRDVLTNIHQAKSHNQNIHLYSSLAHFRKTFDGLTDSQGPGAIVVSTEAQCCVTALGHIRPGDLFAEEDGSRNGRACSSGSPGCVWKGIERAKPWNDFMEQRADESGNDELADIYLNAGLIAGKAKDLITLIQDLDMQEDEDDQAVLMAFMYRNPGRIALDYEQSMFGNNRWAMGDEEGCMFDIPSAENEDDATPLVGRRLVHFETGQSPLFIHSSGHFVSCHQQLLDKLQTQSTNRGLRMLYNDTRSINTVDTPDLSTAESSSTPENQIYRIAFKQNRARNRGRD